MSFGYGGCASSTYQDVYTNVASFAPWIESYANGEKCKPSDVTVDDGDDSDPTQDDTVTEPTEGDDAGTAADELEGDDAAADDEEVSDLDVFLDCFRTVYDLVQSVLGAQDNAKGGNNNSNNQGGKGAVTEPSAIFMRNFINTEDGTVDTESTENEPQEDDISNARKVARRFWNGVQGILGGIAGGIEVDGEPLFPEP